MIIGAMAVLLLFSLLFFVYILNSGFAQRLPEGQYFGRITETHANIFKIKDRAGNELRVFLNNGADIREGRKAVTADALEPGASVFIIGRPGTPGEIEALVVRIFPERK